jgi:hypothetical protein
MKAKEIERKLGPITENALTLQEYQKDDWLKVAKNMTWILSKLLQLEDFTDEQIISMGLRLDEWTVDWILLVGKRE